MSELSPALASLRLYFIVGLATVVLLLIGEWAHLFTGALYNDDGWWIGMPLTGARVNAPDSYFLFHELIFAIGSSGSVVALRLLLLFAHGVAAALLAKLLVDALWRPLLAALTSVAVLSLPIFLSQHVFVSASHSILALPFALAGIIFLHNGAGLGRALQIFAYVTSAVFLQLAVWLSPIFSLFPLLVVLLPLTCWRSSEKHRIGVVCYLLISALVLYTMTQALLVNPHVYTQLQGWTDISFAQPFRSLSNALLLIWRRVTAGPLLVDGILLIGLVAFLASILFALFGGLRKSKPSPQPTAVAGYRMAFLLLLCSAFSMAPAAFLTFISDRYCLIPMVFGLPALFVLLRQLSATEVPRTLAVPGLLLLILGNTINASIAKASMYEGFRELHDEMVTVFAQDGATWKANAQILVLADSALEGRGPANGFIHFSTGYLRYVSGRDDITGLIGPASLANGPPFAKSPNLFGTGADYWQVINGKYQRLVMVGLIEDRSLYTYQQAEDGSLVRVDQVIFPQVGGSARISNFGEVQKDLPLESGFAFCNLIEDPTILVWPTPPVSIVDIGSSDKQLKQCAASFEREYLFAGTDTETFSLAPKAGDFISLELDLAPAGDRQWNGAYTPVSPKMPLLGDQIALYSLGSQLRIVDRSNDKSFTRAATGKRTVRFTGIQGCRLDVYLNDDHLGSLSGKNLQGAVLMGKGFLQRQWAGTITVKYEQKRKDGCE